MSGLGFNKGFMHIKKRTEGTSNELSFSVLDAKSNNAQQGSGGPTTVNELGKVSVFTLPNKQSGGGGASVVDLGMQGWQQNPRRKIATGATTLGGSAEVANRKQRRQARRLLNIAATLALLGVLFVVGGNLYSNITQRQQDRQISLAGAVSLIEQTDEAILALDQAVSAQATADQTSLGDLFASLSAASSLLDRATNYAEEANVSANEGNIQIAVSEIKEDTAARKALIVQGRLVLDQAAAAKTATTYATRAWEATLEASDLATQAAAALEEGARQNITRSTELSTQALNRFQDALVLVRQAKSAYPQANFSQLEQYLELRAGAQQNALVGNAALQENNSEAASINSAAYNEAEQKAAEIARQLPENAAQLVADAYAATGEETLVAYNEARARASRSDEAIRELRNAF